MKLSEYKQLENIVEEKKGVTRNDPNCSLKCETYVRQSMDSYSSDIPLIKVFYYITKSYIRSLFRKNEKRD